MAILLRIIFGNVHHAIIGKQSSRLPLARELHIVHDSKKIIVALDYDNLDSVISFIDSIDPKLCRIKIGKELFTKYGPNIVNNIHEKGFEIFLDLKFHDIPTTVYKACISAFSLDIWMLNIHLTGGYDMTVSAMKAKRDCQSTSKLIGVTALTSLSDDDCIKIYGCKRIDQLKRLRDIGLEADIDGFVCSPYDINALAAEDKIFVTPGIRTSNNTQDHHKVITPVNALQLGSTYLVIGRSITESSEPTKELKDIYQSL